MANSVYTAYWVRTLAAAPGGAYSSMYTIRAPGRKIKIRSISLDWALIDLTTNRRIPEEANDLVQLGMVVGEIVPPVSGQISQSLTHLLGGLASSAGGGFRISKNCNYHFDGFYAANELPFFLELYNFSPTDQITVTCTLIVEANLEVMY